MRDTLPDNSKLLCIELIFYNYFSSKEDVLFRKLQGARR